jgi:hypothetical protein
LAVDPECTENMCFPLSPSDGLSIGGPQIWRTSADGVFVRSRSSLYVYQKASRLEAMGQAARR